MKIFHKKPVALPNAPDEAGAPEPALAATDKLVGPSNLLRLGALVSDSARLRAKALSPLAAKRDHALTQALEQAAKAPAKRAWGARIAVAALAQTLTDDRDPAVARNAWKTLGAVWSWRLANDAACAAQSKGEDGGASALHKAGVRPEALVRGWAEQHYGVDAVAPGTGHPQACARACAALPAADREACVAALAAHPHPLAVGTAALIHVETGDATSLRALLRAGDGGRPENAAITRQLAIRGISGLLLGAYQLPLYQVLRELAYDPDANTRSLALVALARHVRWAGDWQPLFDALHNADLREAAIGALREAMKAANRTPALWASISEQDAAELWPLLTHEESHLALNHLGPQTQWSLLTTLAAKSDVPVDLREACLHAALRLNTKNALDLACTLVEATPKLAEVATKVLKACTPRSALQQDLILCCARHTHSADSRRWLFADLYTFPQQQDVVAALLTEWAAEGRPELLDAVARCPAPAALPDGVLSAFAQAVANAEDSNACLRDIQLRVLRHATPVLLQALASAPHGPILKLLQDAHFATLAHRWPEACPNVQMDSKTFLSGPTAMIAAQEDAMRKAQHLHSHPQRLEWFKAMRAAYPGLDGAFAERAASGSLSSTTLQLLLREAPACAGDLAMLDGYTVMRLVEGQPNLWPGFLQSVCADARLARYLRDHPDHWRTYKVFSEARRHLDGAYTLETLLIINQLRTNEGYPYSTRLDARFNAVLATHAFDLDQPDHVLTRLSLREMFPFKDRLLARLQALYPQTWAALNAGKFNASDATHRALAFARMMELPHAFKLLAHEDFALQDLQQLISSQVRRGDVRTQAYSAMETSFLAYEAKMLHDQVILPALKRAKKLNRPLMLVSNCTYGGTATTALPLRALRAQGVRITATKQSSTDAHPNQVLKPNVLAPHLFGPEDARFIVEQQPLIIVVDGSYKGHLPDSFRGYRNFAMLANEAFGHTAPEGAVFEPGTQHDPLREYLTRVAAKAPAPRESMAFFTTSLPLGRWERNEFAPQDQDPMTKPLTNWKQVKGPAIICVQTSIPAALAKGPITQVPGAAEHQLAYFDDRDDAQQAHAYLGKRGVKIKPAAIHRPARDFYKELEGA